MISSKLKEYVDHHMKNMEVISLGNRQRVNFATNSNEKSGPTIEQLRNKYLSEDYQSPVLRDTGRKKDEDDIEVVLLKKKKSAGQDNDQGADERTIIGSNENGPLGSQG